METTRVRLARAGELGLACAVESRAENASGFAGQQQVVLSERMASSARAANPVLKGLLVTAAGYFPKAAGHVRCRDKGIEQAILIFCVKGAGWCEFAGERLEIGAGDLLVLPPNRPHAYGAEVKEPWTIYWAHLAGGNLSCFLKEFGALPASQLPQQNARREDLLRNSVDVRLSHPPGLGPVLRVSEDLQLTLLFTEVLETLKRGLSLANFLHASLVMGHLVGLAIRHRHAQGHDTGSAARKIAQSIVYMSEHLDQPLRVSALANLANLSSAHFTVLFKEQTGCSPKDYLQLLRIHRACQLLQSTGLSIKVIAGRLGYQDQFHFSRQFKAFQGVSPSDFRSNPLG